MNTPLRLTASTLVIASLLAGCKPAALAERPASAGSQADMSDRIARKVSDEAARAIASGDFAEAVRLAENLVAFSPRDAGYRTLLAQAYLRSGRFVSADQAYGDVIRLMQDNDKARVAQAVAKIGYGDIEGARAVLAGVTRAPAEDLGLALALAGETGRAVAVLEPAARGMSGTSRTRQNLALAYALDRQWDKARAVAAQDVSPAELDRRLESWARLASPDARDQRIASLLGVSPVAGDAGQPVALALVKPDVPVAIAAALPAVLAAPAAPVEEKPAEAIPTVSAIAMAAPAAASAVSTVPAMAPVHQPVAPAIVPAGQLAVASAETPVQPVAPSTPAVMQSIVATPKVVFRPIAPEVRVPAAAIRSAALDVAVANAATPETVKGKPGTLGRQISAQSLVNSTRVAFEPQPLIRKVEPRGEWVVQLGAYRNQARVEAGWVHLTDNFKRLAQFTPSHSIFTVTATGAVYHRLSVSGFASRGAAAAMCQAMRGQGAQCFVRRDLNDRPFQMASRKTERLARL